MFSCYSSIPETNSTYILTVRQKPSQATEPRGEGQISTAAGYHIFLNPGLQKQNKRKNINTGYTLTQIPPLQNHQFPVLLFEGGFFPFRTCNSYSNKSYVFLERLKSLENQTTLIFQMCFSGRIMHHLADSPALLLGGARNKRRGRNCGRRNSVKTFGQLCL